MFDDRVDNGFQILVSDLFRDRPDAAQGDLLLCPEMRLEPGGRENLETPAVDAECFRAEGNF